MQAIKSN